MSRLRLGLHDTVLDLIHSYIGSVNYGAKAVLMWNIALDDNGQPLLPGSDSCQNPPCRGVVTINDGSYTLNEECGLTHVYRSRWGLTSSLIRSLHDGPGVSCHHSQRPWRTMGPEDRCECGWKQRVGSQGYRFCHQEEQPLRLVALQYRRVELVRSHYTHSFVTRGN